MCLQNEKYRIELIAGGIDFTEDFDSCIVKRDEIAEILSSMFPDAQKIEEDYAHSADPSGNSIKDAVYFIFDSGADIGASCINFEETLRINSKKMNTIKTGNKVMKERLSDIKNR